MPTCKRHWERLTHDLDMLGKLSKSNLSIEWQITILFYIAVHAVDALLADGENPQHPNTHDTRDSYINYEGHFKKLNEDEYESYRALYSLSIKARYMSAPKQVDYTKVTQADLFKALCKADFLLGAISKKLGRTINPVQIHCSNIANPSHLTFFKSLHEKLPIAS